MVIAEVLGTLIGLAIVCILGAVIIILGACLVLITLRLLRKLWPTTGRHAAPRTRTRTAS